MAKVLELQLTQVYTANKALPRKFTVSPILLFRLVVVGFPGGSVGKESDCNAGDPGSIPGLERSPGEGKGNPLQYSSLENSMDRGTWKAPVHGITELDITETLTLSLYQITVVPE